jgi:signal transduction histidine kinase/CHASE1-domain containing sensor protein
VLATALLATALSYLAARSVSAAQAFRRFDRIATVSADAIRSRMDAYLGMLRASAGLVAALGRPPTAAEFHAHFSSLDPEGHFPGIQGLGWARALRPDEVSAHERAEQEAGQPGYRVWPRGVRDLYSATVLLEPRDGRNRQAIGFDMYSEAVRREALDRSRDTGTASASGRVELVHDAGDPRPAGFLVYLPVYSGHEPPASVAERRARLIGWVFATFRAGDLLRETVGVLTEGAVLTLSDGSDPAPGAPLLSSAGSAPGEPQLERSTRLAVAGNTWTLRLVTSAPFMTAAERNLPPIVLTVGLAVSLLVFWLTWQETQARSRAEGTAGRTTFLADAGGILHASFDYPATLAGVARLAAERIADLVMLYVIEPDEEASWIVAHRDPALAARAAAALRGWRPPPDEPAGPSAALRLGTPVLERRLRFDRPPLSRLPALAPCLVEAGVRAALTVPLVARGERLGAIVLLTVERDRAFRPEAIALAEDLARLVVAAVESARLYRRAQEAVRSRDEFLSVASHELRTPITSLALQADGLRSSAQRGDTDAFLRKVEVIRRSVRRLAGLVSSMLDLSRIQAGRLELELENVDLADVAREVVSRFEDEAQRAMAPLRLDAPVPVRGRWDRMRLDQVVTNLVSNALKYGQGKPVDVSVTARGDLAVLVVRDSGIGIAPEDHPRIFERFERAASDRHYGGFGLGLWIVRELVLAMGGEVRLESSPGAGSTFAVELRREPTALPAADPGADPAPPADRSRAGPD